MNVSFRRADQPGFATRLAWKPAIALARQIVQDYPIGSYPVGVKMTILSVCRPIPAVLFGFSGIILAIFGLLTDYLGFSWSTTQAHQFFGSMTGPAFYLLCITATALNLPTFLKRKSYVVLHPPLLQVVGFKPLPLNEIERFEIVEGALKPPTLRIFGNGRRVSVSSLFAATPLLDIQAAIEKAQTQ